eukprot:1166171-Amphidinium_carterae.1
MTRAGHVKCSEARKVKACEMFMCLMRLARLLAVCAYVLPMMEIMRFIVPLTETNPEVTIVVHGGHGGCSGWGGTQKCCSIGGAFSLSVSRLPPDGTVKALKVGTFVLGPAEPL